jgi:hypothetical protein
METKERKNSFQENQSLIKTLIKVLVMGFRGAENEEHWYLMLRSLKFK